MPALREAGWRGVQSELLEGHAALRSGLADMLTVKAEAEAFDATLARLMRLLTEQLALEETQLFPLLKTTMDERQRQMLAFEAEEYLSRILGDQFNLVLESLLAPGAKELLEEAQMVLGGIGPRTRRQG